MVAGCALALAVVAGSLALQQREHLVGYNPLTDETVTSEGALAEAATDYVVGVVAPLTDAYESLAAAATTIDQDPTLSSSGRAALLEQAVVSPLRGLADRWGQLEIAAEPVREVHRAAVEALNTALAKYSLLAEAYRREDAALLEQVRTLHQQEAAWWREWFDRRQALAASVTES